MAGAGARLIPATYAQVRGAGKVRKVRAFNKGHRPEGVIARAREAGIAYTPPSSKRRGDFSKRVDAGRPGGLSKYSGVPTGHRIGLSHRFFSSAKENQITPAGPQPRTPGGLSLSLLPICERGLFRQQRGE